MPYTITTRPAALAALALTLAALPATARAEADADSGPEIIVDALRTPVDRDRVASSVTVIDAAALGQAQPVALTDVLARTPGIAVGGNGGYGAAETLRLRGAGPGETVIVIDGMRMSDPSAIDGGFDISQLFADDAARIEILRGPQSILWGSDAIGGIVNVTTVAPTKPLEADISLEGGSHQSVNTHAGLGGTSALLDWRVAGSLFSTAGIPAQVGDSVPDGYNRKAASATLTFHLAPGASLDLRGYWDSARNDYADGFSFPAFASEYGLEKQWSVYAGLNVALLGGRWHNRLAVLANKADNEQYEPLYFGAAPSFIGHGRTVRYEYQGTLALTRGVELVFGAEREEQHMRAGSPYDAVTPYELFPYHAATDSLYGEARVTPLPGLTLNGGVRYDHHSQFGGNTVFSAGAVYTPDAGTSLVRFTWDQAFKAPSLYQLYSDYGLATLKPEHAAGWELGAERTLFGKALHLSAAWWERRASNLIDFGYCLGGPSDPPACAINHFGYYANVDAARGRGLELTASARIGHVFADGNYAIVVNADRTPGSFTFGRQLPHVPRHTANATLGYDFPIGLTASVAVRRVSASYDSTFSTAVLPGYTVVDLRGEWRLPSGLTVFGRIENLGDERYQTVGGYNMLGRSAWLGVRGHF